MSELPSREAFAGCLHNPFHLLEDGGAGMDLELVEVSELQTDSRQQVFSLIFEGPLDRFLPQKIYRLAHARLGEIDLFMVPTAQSAGAFVYEVVFNQLLPGS